MLRMTTPQDTLHLLRHASGNMPAYAVDVGQWAAFQGQPQLPPAKHLEKALQE